MGIRKLYIDPEFREQEIRSLNYYKEQGIQKSDVELHMHRAGEECTEECRLWQVEGGEDNR